MISLKRLIYSIAFFSGDSEKLEKIHDHVRELRNSNQETVEKVANEKDINEFPKNINEVSFTNKLGMNNIKKKFSDLNIEF